LPPEKSLDIARQLCAGLAAAHDGGVLHRDLKPANIMLDGRGRIRIMDFGLAVSTREGAVSEIAGTPGYMAPEQLVRDQITEQTDLYALGLVLYEIFVGRPFFTVHTLEERVRFGHSAPAPAFGPEVDPQVAAIISACLANSPGDRPTTALSVSAILPGGDPLTAALAEGRVPSPARRAVAGDPLYRRARRPGDRQRVLVCRRGRKRCDLDPVRLPSESSLCRPGEHPPHRHRGRSAR
jgi:serine/threonine-protein kinase